MIASMGANFWYLLTLWISGPYVEIDMRSGVIDGYDAVFSKPP